MTSAWPRFHLAVPVDDLEIKAFADGAEVFRRE